MGGSHCWRALLSPSDVWKVPSILAPTCPSGTVLKCLLSPLACSCHIKPHNSGSLVENFGVWRRDGSGLGTTR